jgi:hypothetical protein
MGQHENMFYRKAAANMKSILAVDVESTCWLGKPPSGEQSEIIEIGVSRLCWVFCWKTTVMTC